MGLNQDLENKSENLRRMNHFEKYNKANRIFAENARIFSIIICVGVKDWRKSNMIWDALYFVISRTRKISLILTLNFFH